MSPDKLVHMVNQIAAFFASQPPARQVPGVTNHLRDFWAPEMRSQLLQIAAAGEHEIHPGAQAAVEALRGEG